MQQSVFFLFMALLLVGDCHPVPENVEAASTHTPICAAYTEQVHAILSNADLRSAFSAATLTSRSSMVTCIDSSDHDCVIALPEEEATMMESLCRDVGSEIAATPFNVTYHCYDALANTWSFTSMHSFCMPKEFSDVCFKSFVRYFLSILFDATAMEMEAHYQLSCTFKYARADVLSNNLQKQIS
jgi:hypothetical protein